MATGFPGLDVVLGGGWPTGVLTELLVPAGASAELSLLAPALAWLTASRQGWVLLIAPPWLPYAPGLTCKGVMISRLLMVRSRQPLEGLWAMEEALRSGACMGVIAWVAGAARVVTQRLQLLAGRRQVLAVLVRPARFRRERSAARLRLQLLRQSSTRMHVEVFRNRWQPPRTVILERQP